jgi:hypothetical protein
MLRTVWELAAGAVCGLSLPLFADLALVVVGNAVVALRPERSSGHRRRSGPLGVVIPAHNEERMIAQTVRSVAVSAEVCGGVRGGSARIFVVAHNCTDGTVAAARAAEAEVVELNDDGRDGKSAALRTGFAFAQGQGCTAFAVVDADSTVSLNFVAAMQDALASGAEALQCRYEQTAREGAMVSDARRLRMLAFRGMNVVRGRGRAALGLSSGIFGNGFLLRASLLERVPYEARSIAEDLEHHANLVAQGGVVRWVDAARVTAGLAETKAAHDSQETRWEGGRLRVAWSAGPRLLGAALRGNPRAGEALLAVLSLPFSLGVAAALVSVALPVAWSREYGLASLGIGALYLATAAQIGSDSARFGRALRAAPALAARKLMLIPKIVAQAGRRVMWVRTGRESTHDGH